MRGQFRAGKKNGHTVYFDTDEGLDFDIFWCVAMTPEAARYTAAALNHSGTGQGVMAQKVLKSLPRVPKP